MKHSFLVLLLFLAQDKSFCNFNLTIVGDVNYNSGMERIPITLIEMLEKDFRINHIAPKYIKFEGISESVTRILKNLDKSAGKISLLTNPIGYPRINLDFYKKVPNSKIKIAYSMLESSAIPKEWVSIINSFFDAVVVPDKWLVSVYEKSGVKKPIFVIPIPLFLDDFLNYIPKKSSSCHKSFIFGCSAACSPGKNIEKVIKAFHKEFRKNENVFLRLHSRGGSRTKEIKALLSRINNKRIIFYNQSFSEQEYIEFMAGSDCYIQIAQGEGFSITPREALALGIPCIISNNTTHKTICESGCVYPVPANKIVPAYYDVFKKCIGNKFDCELKDVCSAMHEVYTNYEKYHEKAQKGKAWVQQYLPARLKPLYKSLFSPKKIILGENNYCTEALICTSSVSLYEKYSKLFN